MSQPKVMNRAALTKPLVAKLKHDEAVIGGIGNSNFDLWSAGHRPQNFYMLGSMGLAVPIAVGVAVAQPQRHRRHRGRRLDPDVARLPLHRRAAQAAQPDDHHRRQRHLPDHRQAADHDAERRRHRRDRAPLASRTAPGSPTRRISMG
jgi:hypothetical protein